QLAREVLQLRLVELQADGFAQQGIELASQAVEQFAAALRQLQQRGAHGLAVSLRLFFQQRGDELLWVVQLFTVLVEFELVQADIGDVVGQSRIGFQQRQAPLLFEENLRQQQAAAQYIDLLLQRLLTLGQVVQALFGTQVG